MLVEGDHGREGPGRDELSGAGVRAPWWRGRHGEISQVSGLLRVPRKAGGGPEVLEGGGRRGRVCAWDWRRLLTPPFSSVPEGLGPHTRPGKRAHPELRAGVGEEVHFAEVVARGQQLPLVRPADGVDVRPVRALWPHA